MGPAIPSATPPIGIAGADSAGHNSWTFSRPIGRARKSLLWHQFRSDFACAC